MHVEYNLALFTISLCKVKLFSIMYGKHTANIQAATKNPNLRKVIYLQ